MGSSWPDFFLRWLGKGRKKGKAQRKKAKQAARVQEDTFGRATVRSLGGFILGMTLSAAYGALVIFGQGYSIWYCLVSTITLAIVLGLGMAFSFKVRVTVLLMLPQFFSKEGKMVLILLAFGMAMEGPFANIVRNFNRSADTVACGAELALNQTAEMLQRAREPLINALKKIKDIARKAKVVGDRVRKLFRSVMDAVRHVVLLVFCIIPEYIVPFLRRRVAELRGERQCQQEALRGGLRHHGGSVRASTTSTGSGGTLRALLYRKHYLHEDSFDNIYITKSFLEMDAEQIAYALALARICRQFILVILLIVADFSVYWLFDLVRYHLVGEIVARAPVLTTISVNGSGYTSELYRDLVSAFDVLQEGNISVVSPKCRLHPSEPDYNGYLVIGSWAAIFGTYIQRMRRVLCAWYYPSRERERVCYLYNTILTRRTKLISAVLRAVRQNSADEGHRNILLVFAAKFRLCRWLVKKLGVHEAYCMGCGKIQRGEESEDFVTCITPACR
ncbi:DC-STAMP domain-containing protein 2, partial [Ophiophagus hannah]